MTRVRPMLVYALVVLPGLATLGCAEANFKLSSDSAIPQQWRDDPRTRGWKGYYIEYVCYWDESVVARLAPAPVPWYWDVIGWAPGCFKVKGTSWDENPQRSPGDPMVVWFSFNGVAERYQLLDVNPARPWEGVTLLLLAREDGVPAAK